MSRSILTIMNEIIRVLAQEGELSIRQVARRVRTSWQTALRGLRFLKTVNYVQERRNTATKRGDRLFSLARPPVTQTA